MSIPPTGPLPLIVADSHPYLDGVLVFGPHVQLVLPASFAIESDVVVGLHASLAVCLYSPYAVDD